MIRQIYTVLSKYINQVNMKKTNLKTIMQITFLGTVGALLMMLQFPYPGTEWLRLDFSDIPALIGGFALGPVAGLWVILIKNLLFAVMRFSPHELLGLPMNLIANGILVVIAAVIYQRNKTQKNAVAALILGVLASVLVMIPANYFILPFFMRFFMPAVEVPSSKNLWIMILYFIVPFNILKGTLNGMLTFLVYKKIAVFLRPAGEIGRDSREELAVKNQGAG